MAYFLLRKRLLAGSNQDAHLTDDDLRPAPRCGVTPERDGVVRSSRRRVPRHTLLLILALAVTLAPFHAHAQPAQLVFTSEPPLDAQVGAPYSYTMTARLQAGVDDDDDDDDDGPPDPTVRFIPQVVPRWLTFDGTATLSGTPAAQDVGRHSVVILALARGRFATQRFAIDVAAPPAPNRPPVFTGSTPQSVNPGDSVDIDVAASFSDPDADPLTFAQRGMPPWLALTGNRITGVAPDDAAGSTFSFTVIATDAGGASTEGTLSVTVTAVNRAPQVARPIEPDPQHAFVGEPFAFDVAEFFTDPDDDTLTFTATGLPNTLAIAANGRITGTPTADDAARSPFMVTVRAADPATAAVSDAFTLVVETRNAPPVLERALPDPQRVTAGESYRFDAGAFFADPDGDALLFSAGGLPTSLRIDSATGVISGTPADGDEGSHAVRVTASDGVASASGRYSLDIVVVDEPPVLPDPPPALSTPEDTPLEITPQLLDARDEDVESLSVVLTPPSADADFTLTGGGRVVQPKPDFNGTLTVEASVRDATSSSNRVMLAIEVTPVNDAPRIETVPAQTASEGVPFELSLRDFVSDPEDDPITFSAAGLPPDLSLDSASGAISGTPAVAAAAGPHTVEFTAQDAEASSSASFELRVTAADRADLSVEADVAPNPALTGSAATFTFTVSNASGIDVGNASFDVAFTGDAPFVIDDAADPDCALEPDADTVALRCTFASFAAGASRSVDVTGSAEQAAEISAAARVAIAEGVPIDDVPDNDEASITLVVARSLGTGAAEEIAAPDLAAVAIGDFDGDGAPDLAAAGPAQPVLVFVGREGSADGERAGFSSEPIAIGEPLDAIDLAAADIDGDGDTDLVAADANGAHQLLLNDGAGSFAPSAVAGGTRSEGLTIADFDGDGRADLAFAGRDPGANRVYLSGGGGALADAGAILDVPAADVAAADVGGGPAQLVFATEAGYLAIVNVDGTPAGEIRSGPGESLTSADFDGDGRADLVLARRDGSDPDGVFVNTSAAAASFFLAAELGRAATVTALADDFDMDGRTDIVAISADGGHRLYTNSSAANLEFVLAAEQFATTDAKAAAAGDLNGDGRPDVAVASSDGIAVFLNDGRGNLGRGDETAPTLSLVGDPRITIVVGESYTDPGATASDDVDGDLTDRIVVDNPVDVDVIGAYTVTYNVTDSSGNSATTLTRTVDVTAREAGGGGGGGRIGLAMLLSLGAALGLRGTRKERARAGSAMSRHPGNR